ncbi:hypothetical protein GCM10009625_40290 [Brachybacterium fresconis]
MTGSVIRRIIVARSSSPGGRITSRGLRIRTGQSLVPSFVTAPPYKVTARAPRHFRPVADLLPPGCAPVADGFPTTAPERLARRARTVW